MFKKVPHNLYRFLIRISVSKVNVRRQCFHSQKLYTFFLNPTVDAGKNPFVGSHASYSTSCQWDFTMPKRRLRHDWLISLKTRKVEIENARTVVSPEVMGGICCNRAEDVDSDDCTEQTTLLSTQTSSRNISQKEALISVETPKQTDSEKKDSSGSLDDSACSTSNSPNEADSIAVATISKEVPECVGVHAAQTQDKSSTNDQLLIDVTIPNDQLRESRTTDQSDTVSTGLVNHGNKTKPTVLPKELLEDITSLVSEKCEGDEEWVQNSLGESPDSEGNENLLGSLFSQHPEDRGNFTNKVICIDDEQASETTDRKKKKKSEKPKKPRPNYFVAVQITNPEIHFGLSEVQLAVLSSNIKMKEVMNKLPTLHLTILTLCLESPQDIQRASQALDDCAAVLSDRFKEGLPVMEVAGIGSFRNEVVFAKVTPGDALNELMYIHDCVKEKMANHGILPTDNSSLTPHITIMKMSKVKGYFRRTVAKKIDAELYSKFKDMTFGTETIRSLQLCSMLERKDSVGYYQVPHRIYLGQGEATLTQFSQSLVQSVLVSALEKVKQDSWKKTTGDGQPTQSEKKDKSSKRKNSKEESVDTKK